MNDSSIVERLEKIENSIKDIQLRNMKVEQDKAWERSLLRRIFIVSITYLLTCVVFWSIGVRSPFFNAIVPTLGYYLSTLSLSFLKSRFTSRAH